MLLAFGPTSASAQQLEKQLLAEPATQLATAALTSGNAARGAIVFHQQSIACGTCHTTGTGQSAIGPDLTQYDAEKLPSDVELVDSVLRPSQAIRDGYQSVMLVLDTGRVEVGQFISENAQTISLRTARPGAKPLQIPKAKVEARKQNSQSLMPAGQVNQLSGRQQFLDLVRYLIAIRDGGAETARKLQPPPHLLVAPPVPEYENNIDHAAMIASLDDESFQRGEAIYSRLCVNCHGTKDQPGSLPTSLRFASGNFKNGNDPFAMYQTLTRGFGIMLPQTWMVPQQKYDVVHYIRQAYLKPHNPDEHFDVNDSYLTSLPKGTSIGPAPVEVQPWVNMDYGPSMINTFETGDDALNFAHKGIAVRLDAGPGGVSRGHAWTIFDHDTMRMSTAWVKPDSSSLDSFINWQGIHFNGRHNIHPRVSGDVHLQNHNGPGWSNPSNGSLDDPRLVGRDGRKYGPLPNEWAKLNGIYSHGSQTIIDYQIGDTTILESPQLIADVSSTKDQRYVFGRQMNVGRRDREMTLRVASLGANAKLRRTNQSVAIDYSAGKTSTNDSQTFDGGSFLQTAGSDRFEMRTQDFTLLARIRTTSDGAIFTQTLDQTKWVPGGKSLFIRDGLLNYDIGWVGAVRSLKRVTDGRWHDIAMTWKNSGEVKFFVDGKPSGGGKLKPKRDLAKPVIRIGHTASNFPAKPFFKGDLQNVQFVPRALNQKQIGNVEASEPVQDAISNWPLDAPKRLLDTQGLHPLVGVVNGAAKTTALQIQQAGLSIPIQGASWSIRDQNQLCLTLPPGDAPIDVVLWTRSANGDQPDAASPTVLIDDPKPNLRPLTKGGPQRWPEKLTTKVQLGDSSGAFAADVLQVPTSNPWLARLRLTGFDFFDDGDSMAICTWDGDVWQVTGLSQIDHATAYTEVELTWQRIGSGLFQPLGLRIVGGRIYVSCRDQICILNDQNGDGETDFYECFNRDHQVTEHFHEFAMGLQTDDEGNFYYAKSARHALKAVVPHHGTLLKVSKDGSETEILAKGFRAANGVCLNPDGTFIVTDQEGHWNPKNRINWVRKGGFYGNMFGYHDVTNSSDSAMEQPLCWITNAFDRSPAELLWVDSEKWGPLNHRLLNLSYGYGKVYLVPHEDIDGQKQGGMIELPIDQFPTGVMRGRFRPDDQQLYLCGMFAWGSSQQQQDGGLYRLRCTGKPIQLPVELSATNRGVTLGFSGEIDRTSAADPKNYSVRVWSLRRTANYGSKHYDERELNVAEADLSADGKTVSLTIPEISPTWCMEIRYRLLSIDGKEIDGTLHNSIHRLKADPVEN
ncbi:DUF6797 domain-containing protein [Stieleria marina]|uniref:Cytochrome c n=1 Tax=Stieleria marina TaxID=1930275 RepID=A0A517NX81_9BACT|nr:Cytochrome c [Planctomycetes bacterium K23_9]